MLREADSQQAEQSITPGSYHSRTLFSFLGSENIAAPGEDRTHDLQMARVICDYETDALPTALPRQVELCQSVDLTRNVGKPHLRIEYWGSGRKGAGPPRSSGPVV